MKNTGRGPRPGRRGHREPSWASALAAPAPHCCCNFVPTYPPYLAPPPYFCALPPFFLQEHSTVVYCMLLACAIYSCGGCGESWGADWLPVQGVLDRAPQPRRATGFPLQYAVSGRGACHTGQVGSCVYPNCALPFWP